MYISSNPALSLLNLMPLGKMGGYERALAGRRVHMYSRVREALADLVQSSGIKPGDAVLLPGYICPSVIDPFEKLNIRILFYPVDCTLSPDLAAVQRLLWEKPRAILIVHYFGFSARAEEVIQECRAQRILIIEDCAHTLPDDELGIGDLGDVVMYSLPKLLPVPDGALAVVNSTKEWYSQPIKENRRLVMVNLAWQIANALEVRLGKSLRTHLRDRRGASQMITTWREPPISAAARSAYPRFRMSLLAQRIQRTMNFGTVARRRLANYSWLAGQIKGIKGVRLIFDNVSPAGAPLGLPIWVEQREQVRRILIAIGVDPRPIWSGLPHQVPTDGFSDARSIAAHNIVLPVHQDLTRAHLEQVASALERALSMADKGTH